MGPKWYGKTFEVVMYDGNNNLVPLLFYLSVSTECQETWTTVFAALKGIPGFDVDGRVAVVDQDK